MRRLTVALLAILLLVGCNDGRPEGREFAYPTHCRVAQVSIDGVRYYPTGIYEDSELIATDDHSTFGGPTPWEDVEGAMNMNDTFGYLVDSEGDTKAFNVKGTDYVVHLSPDPADAAWTVEGCA
ncbi:hypothetical protein [Demequina sp.]|uniref:hypothetical protein n=1 Tax=Demequina sp. TaxID=2050685 RepID=UPI003D11C13B